MRTATAWDLNIVAGESFFSKMVLGLLFQARTVSHLERCDT